MKTQRIVMMGGIILAILIVVPLVSFLLLNSAWLKQKLARNVQKSLNAELDVGQLAFDVWKGQAVLEDVTFSRHEESSDLDLTVQSAQIRVAVWPLLYRSVQIQYLELNRPQMTSVVRRMSKPKETPPETPDQKKRSRKRADLLIEQLVVRDGAVDATFLREGREPLHAIVTDIQYTATNVTPQTLFTLLAGADLHCQIAMGNATSMLDKTGTTSPASFSLTNLDLPYLSDYLLPDSPDIARTDRQDGEKLGRLRNLITKAESFLDESTDLLRITSGTLDLLYTFSKADQYGRMTLELRDFRVAPLSETPDQKFLFVPVERIITYLSEHEGNLTFDLELEENLTMSPDLDYLVREIYKGFWIALLKEVSPDSVSDLIEQGARKALDILQSRENEEVSP